MDNPIFSNYYLHSGQLLFYSKYIVIHCLQNIFVQYLHYIGFLMKSKHIAHLIIYYMND